MGRLVILAMLLLAITVILVIPQPALAQEGGSSLESDRPPDAPRRRSAMEENDYGFGEYKPTGGKNVYCYAIFIFFSLITVFLAFRGNKKG